MQINKEPKNAYSIQSYTDTSVTIQQQTYRKNLIISNKNILESWQATSLKTLNEASLAPLLSTEPEIIIIGHLENNTMPPVKIMQQLSQQRIGFECMNLGAACRTFNILLSEDRKVALGIIFNN